MIIQDIYAKYLLPKNLQVHMLRVAALSEIILGSWKGEAVDKAAITNVCLFHDIAKPLTFVPEKQAKYGATPGEIENIKEFQKIIAEKYGKDEHTATLAICMEEGLGEKAVSIMRAFRWDEMKKIFDTNNLHAQIVLYCDMRIGPNGILSTEVRLRDLKTRYGENKDHDLFHELGTQLELMVQKNVSIDLQVISNDDINNRFPALFAKKIQ